MLCGGMRVRLAEACVRERCRCRFVTRGTVEERIMQRTKEKRALETVVIGRQDLRQQARPPPLTRLCAS